MPKMGPWGPKCYIFGHQFYSKNRRQLRFHVFLHYNAKKHMISSVLPEVDQYCKKLWICLNLVWVSGEPKLEKSSQFLVNSVHFR